MEQILVQNGVKKVQLLPAVNDDHGGVNRTIGEPMDPNVFHNMLRSSLCQRKLQGKEGVWIKLPIELGNLVETAVKGEDIFKGAVREVKEETGIDTEFLEVLAFRQMHRSFFGKSDLFFICMMRPLTFNLQKQDLEIEAVQWMPLEEYDAQPIVLKHGIMRYIKDLCFAKAEGSYPGFTLVPIKSMLLGLFKNVDGCVSDPPKIVYF